MVPCIIEFCTNRRGLVFAEGTEIYWARTRVLEQLGRVRSVLPSDVSPVLGRAAIVVVCNNDIITCLIH